MSSQLSLIESAIDVPLMDTKNISKLIDDYTVEYEEEVAMFAYFKDMLKSKNYREQIDNIYKGLYIVLPDESLNYYERRIFEAKLNDLCYSLLNTIEDTDI